MNDLIKVFKAELFLNSRSFPVLVGEIIHNITCKIRNSDQHFNALVAKVFKASGFEATTGFALAPLLKRHLEEPLLRNKVDL